MGTLADSLTSSGLPMNVWASAPVTMPQAVISGALAAIAGTGKTTKLKTMIKQRILIMTLRLRGR